MIDLTEFEVALLREFELSDRDARRMDRAIEDISSYTGLSKIEVFDFLKFGNEPELKSLKESYDWKRFENKIILKLRKC